LFSIKKVKSQQKWLPSKAITQARILLGLPGSGLSGEGKTSCYFAARFGALFLIGLLTNLPPGDVTRQAKNSTKTG
jgi:hypothetical protein